MAQTPKMRRSAGLIVATLLVLSASALSDDGANQALERRKKHKPARVVLLSDTHVTGGCVTFIITAHRLVCC